MYTIVTKLRLELAKTIHSDRGGNIQHFFLDMNFDLEVQQLSGSEI